ncbi:hypothetical protein FHR32_004759 [Streptosporangium album]|uniref:Uncharacterized protein n=1 Tax=Streptosporangium album TaxID=47479 RepID=A0A7W7WBQ3_9ACTN|nr:hypothetical protein [Streptosporangium album]MBB4940454.1 hypothetical protein [Streptosporangium album]
MPSPLPMDAEGVGLALEPGLELGAALRPGDAGGVLGADGLPDG